MTGVVSLSPGVLERIRRIRLSMCVGKIAFDKRRDAAMKAARQRHAEPLTVYHCPFCSRFHFGREPKPSTKRFYERLLTPETIAAAREYGTTEKPTATERAEQRRLEEA